MGRSRSWRKVSGIPSVTYFKPAGVGLTELEEVVLLVEEAEAIRLKDLDGLEQQECAEKMNISRSTFSRLLYIAHHKISDALLNGKAIRIEGGTYEMETRRFRCIEGHEWGVPFATLISSSPEICPDCRTPSIMPLFPDGWKGGHRHGANFNRR